MVTLQVRLSSSDNKQCQVKHLIESIAAELKTRFSVDLDSAHKPRLHYICLQRDEGAEGNKDPQVRAVNSSLVDFNSKFVQSCLHEH